jgi:hypothetical protein
MAPRTKKCPRAVGRPTQPWFSCYLNRKLNLPRINKWEFVRVLNVTKQQKRKIDKKIN